MFYSNIVCYCMMSLTHPAHADPARLEKVEVLLLLEEDAHLLAESGVGEHPDLCGDVTPVSRGTQLLQLLPQARPHRDNSRGHRPKH